MSLMLAKFLGVGFILSLVGCFLLPLLHVDVSEGWKIVGALAGAIMMGIRPGTPASEPPPPGSTTVENTVTASTTTIPGDEISEMIVSPVSDSEDKGEKP